MKKNSDDAEGEPVVEVRICEGQQQDHSDQRDRFAERASDDESGLNILNVLFGDRLFDRPAVNDD